MSVDPTCSNSRTATINSPPSWAQNISHPYEFADFFLFLVSRIFRGILEICASAGSARKCVMKVSASSMFTLSGLLLLLVLLLHPTVGAHGRDSSRSLSYFESDTKHRQLSSEEVDGDSDQLTSGTEYPPCDREYIDHTPCEDPHRWNAFSRDKMIFRERHCPPPNETLKCLIPPPPGYKSPVPWPASRDECWYANIPNKQLAEYKAKQHWVQYEEATEKFIFPGGGTQFGSKGGAEKFLDELKEHFPLEGGGIRTAFDTGCGVASWGGYLMKRDILTMSMAPRDEHEAQVQFALERGLPAVLGIFASIRQPYPARSFDLAQCSRCLIPWHADGGMFLLELDRLLRPGGYWILSGPPIRYESMWMGWDKSFEEYKEEYEGITRMAKAMGWKKVDEWRKSAVWQKPLNHNDLAGRKEGDYPQFCDDKDDADIGWYTPLKNCQTRMPEPGGDGEASGGDIESWPKRAHVTPPRVLSGLQKGLSVKQFNAEEKRWAGRVAFYKERLLLRFGKGEYRNIMDMNAGQGAFAVNLLKDAVWVMNVMPPSNRVDTLGVVFERGLIGIYHDWCEAFSTYPRTYDLLHCDHVFSQLSKRCSPETVLLEMDRITRPEGAAIIRDDKATLEAIAPLLSAMRWDVRMVDDEVEGDDKSVLVCVKRYWTLS